MKRYTAALLLVGALSCTDSNSPQVHKPSSFSVLPALDTVAAGVSVTFVAERSTVDAWQVSDTSVARIEEQLSGWARVVGLATGTVTIKAKSQGDTGQAILVILPPPPPPPDTGHSGFTISPALDTVTVGQLVQYEVNEWPIDHVNWSFSDPSLVYSRGNYGPAAAVAARATGTVTITAAHQGDTAHATLVIRQPQPGEWEAIDLGVFDDNLSAAIAISDDGTVLGYLFAAAGAPDISFVYKDGAMRRLPGGTPSASPAAISPSGTKIAGYARFYSGPSGQTDVVAVWDNLDAAPRLLRGEGDQSPAIVGVNDRGDVLASVITRDGDRYRARAVLWRDGVRVVLGDLGDSTVEPATGAQAWNASGQIVGSSLVRKPGYIRGRDPTESGGEPEWYHPFFWENGVMHDLGALAPLPCPGAAATDCSWGVAVDINSQGAVVGISNGADGKWRAFIWQNGIMRDLGVAPGHNTAPIEINDRGQVLGTIDAYPDPGPAQVFLWDNGATQIIDADNFYASFLGPNGEVIGTIGGGTAVWQNGRLTDVEKAALSRNVGGSSYPVAVNSRGEIVGVHGGWGWANRAVLWRKKP